ncbi:hypothetical protein L5515_012882 [Caenorhabditis briggsae]|uniref:C-type lectin domain-containing protein n=1 Tax=Caenorhabditis briggsae TaxID=6238 RepID=A0AAE9ETS7_CAEBR|nr:hypothetical protein L5515_012882 [Caenorhabditis briggsae]
MITNIFSLLFCLFLIQSVKCQCHRQGDNYIGDLCYSIQNQKLNNQDAKNYCRGRSMNLAVLHTTLQANFLASQVRAQSGSNEAIFWIGLSRASGSSRFVWDDGTSMTWSNFDGNFPKDNLYVAESVINGKWRTLSGDNVLLFVCSYDPRNGTQGSTATSMETTEGSSSTFSSSSTWSIPTSSIPMSTLTSSPASSSSGSYTKSSPASSSWGTSTMYPTNW